MRAVEIAFKLYKAEMMTKAELVEAAQLDVKPGAAEQLRVQQCQAIGPAPGALEQWCPPSPAHALKALVKPLPPQRAACGVLMDADRLPAHVVQCEPCEKAGGILQVSIDGQTWVNYSGTVEGVDVYSPHIRCIIPTGSPPPITQVIPVCDVCSRPGPTVALRWTHRGFGDAKYQHTRCDACYLAKERKIFIGMTFDDKSQPSGILHNPAVAALLDHRPPPLTHSYGIEDPALPDA